MHTNTYAGFTVHHNGDFSGDTWIVLERGQQSTHPSLHGQPRVELQSDGSYILRLPFELMAEMVAKKARDDALDPAEEAPAASESSVVREDDVRAILRAVPGARGVTDWMLRVLADQQMTLLPSMLDVTEPQSSERQAVMECDRRMREGLREPSDELVYAVAARYRATSCERSPQSVTEGSCDTRRGADDGRL